MAELLRHHEHHDPRIGEIPVPHGPETGDEHDDFPREHTTEHERRIFAHITRPDDSYTPEGVYWADLPLRQRITFVTKVDREEAARELKATGQMMKKDPLSPMGWYFRNAILPGAGLGLEGYVLFSIGNLEPLFHAVWPECWGSSGTACASNWVASVTYLEIVGIMIGQVVVGIIGDWIGRRWGLIQDALIMFVGLLMLTGSWAATLQGWVIFYAWSLFFYGLGVGGEYPITATSSMESAVAAGRLSTREDRLHRGRRVTMAFLMQGWGQFFNQVVLIALLAIFNEGKGAGPYSESAAQFTFRISFALPAIGTLWLVYYRTWKMPRANRQLALAKQRAGVSVTGYDVTALRACCSNFGGRLLATAGTWFCNDVFFYGNKLFQGQFISVISSNPNSLMEKWTWNLINVVVSLAGYYLASLLIDNKLYGRKTMQQVGFFMCFVMFVIPAFNYDYYTSPAGIHAFQAMYFLSSFFNQFGPNSVTFLVAGEVFPTPVRASAHGFSACIGKAGALLASVLYNYIDTPTKFHVVPWFGLAGMLLTWGFLPDTTGLDLREQERRWMYIIQGREKEYHGVAVHPVHLSAWERMRGAGKEYNPDLDLKSQIRDLRTEWEEEQRGGNGEKSGGEEEAAGEGDWSPEIHGYFRQGQGKGKAVEGEEGHTMSDKVQMAQHEQPIEKRGKRKSCMRHCAKFWWIYLLAFIAIVVLAVCLIIFVAIPKIAQSKLDHAELTVDGIIVTKTEEDKFNMAINSTIRSKGGVKAKIAPFAAVMYLEDIESHIPFVHLDFPETESVKIQTVNTTQEVTIPDMDAFTTFNTWLLGNETLRVTVEGKTHVKVNGISRKYGVTFKKTMELTGLNHFKGLAVTSNRVNITHDDNGDNFFGWVDVPNPSVFTIEIGNASFHTYYNSSNIGTAFLDDLFLYPGINNVSMRANISTAPVVRAMSSEPSCDTGIVDFQLGGRDVFNNGEDLAYFGNALSASNLTVPIELATAFERDVGLTFEC